MKCINLGRVINKEEFQAKTDGVERRAKMERCSVMWERQSHPVWLLSMGVRFPSSPLIKTTSYEESFQKIANVVFTHIL